MGGFVRFELYQQSNQQWRWRLRASNNEIIASGEGYWNRADAEHAVNLVMDTNRNTPFVLVPA
jgi:uncharacterized protein YegP (UPF0339 family)